MLKRILSMSIVCLMLLMISACGTPAASNSSSGSSAASSSEASSAGTSAPEAEVFKEVTLRYLGINWGDIPFNRPGNSGVADRIAEKTGVRIDFVDIVQPTDFNEMVNLKIAAGEKLDLISMSGDRKDHKFYVNLINEGYLVNIKGLKIPNLEKYYNPDSLKLLNYNDGLYGIPREAPERSFTVLIRNDLLKKHGYEMPKTFDEFINTVSAIGKAENIKVPFPMPWNDGYNKLLGSFIKSVEGNWKDADGSIKPYYLHSGYVDFLAALKKMYDTGVLAKDFSTAVYAEWEEAWVNGNYVATMYSMPLLAAYNEYVGKTVPGFEVALVPPLKGTIDGVYQAENDKVYLITAITKDCVDLDAASRYIDYVNSPEGFQLAYYGVEGVNYKVAERSDDFVAVDPSFKSGLEGENVYSSAYRVGSSDKLNNSIGLKKNKEYLKIQSNFSSGRGDDFGFVYDENTFKSKNILTAMKDLIKVETIKVIMGQSSLDNWEKAIKQWYDLGGQDYIDDMTTQFKAK
ncbi:MAG: extracellular solute-binding protein [Candidatus Brocadia sp.]|nr:MAG: extracellular solute-binding protein [Candidatus Brocadia sp.]